MKDCKAVSSPAIVENAEPSEGSSANKSEYMSIVGSLIYLSVISRPDIAYAVSRAGQAMANPTAEDFQAVKRILRYLQGTKEIGIQYSKGESTELRGYVDLGRANWILGTRITYTETGSIKIDQEKYLQEILEIWNEGLQSSELTSNC